MKPSFHKKQLPVWKSQQGFTLLELLMVVAILSTVAWMTLDTVGNNNNQVRFEDTKNRLAAIRRAIIGDVSRTVNGAPEVRGYVADMGSLPGSLRDLVSQGSHVANNYSATYGLRVGWNGPYISASSMTGGARFPDAWGNDDGTDNYGWQFNVDVGTGDLTVGSQGLDNASGGTGIYEKDYPDYTIAAPNTPPPLVSGNEYFVEVTDASGNGRLPVDIDAPAPCWKCSSGSSSTRRACEVPSGTGVWESVQGADTYGACRVAGGVWLPPGHVGAGCEDSTKDSASCSGTEYGGGINGVWGGIDIDGNPINKCIDFTRDLSTCTTKDYSGDNSGTFGSWIQLYNGVGICTDTSFTDKASCTVAGETWYLSALSESVCMTIAHRVSGVIAEQDSRPFFFNWDGTRQRLEFAMNSESTAFSLPQGRAGYRLYEFDETANACTDTPFPKTGTQWRHFTVVPGNIIPELEWDIE
ncbi:MAG: prepilin-type N-terminal cleavage/methylation domain-containing protein [Desulfobacter sp.]|nr:MAG: prepilin-type N-terminal cleavage/methylation domain-containing protein [Desulfobacter sp.]